MRHYERVMADFQLSRRTHIRIVIEQAKAMLDWGIWTLLWVSRGSISRDPTHDDLEEATRTI